MSIEQVTCYQLVCQGCGTEKIIPWEDVRDVRLIVRGQGWWCSNEAQSIDSRHVWHIRCESCGPPSAEEGVAR
jgi:hypothetical protein